MRIKGFGIDAGVADLSDDFSELSRALEHYAALGFDYVEIPLHGVGVMVGGQLLPSRFEKLCLVLAQFPLRYTVHAPHFLNLMDLENLCLQKQVFLECLRFAASIGAEVMVYHAGRFLPEEFFYMSKGWHLLSPGLREEMCCKEREALQEVAKEAERLGVTIGIENMRPFLDGSLYSYGEHLSLLVEQVKAVNHPQVGITLDVGHAYLAAQYYHFDFLETIALAAPYVRHIHLHDNFGRVSGYLETNQGELLAAGRGDLHLPVGLGKIPFTGVFGILEKHGFEGVVIHEIRTYCQEWLGIALNQGRRLIGQLEVAG